MNSIWTGCVNCATTGATFSFASVTIGVGVGVCAYAPPAGPSAPTVAIAATSVALIPTSRVVQTLRDPSEAWVTRFGTFTKPS